MLRYKYNDLVTILGGYYHELRTLYSTASLPCPTHVHIERPSTLPTFLQLPLLEAGVQEVTLLHVGTGKGSELDGAKKGPLINTTSPQAPLSGRVMRSAHLPL